MRTESRSIDPHLEREYDVRKLRADFDDIVKGWMARSAVLRDSVRSSIDLAYGPGERQRLDVFHCGTKNAPLLIFLHGGYWQRGDKSVYSFIAEPFLARGCDVCLVGYTLCPAANIPTITGEIRSALAWLWKNAQSIGINRESIHLTGHSAGGHLTAMMLTTNWHQTEPDLPEQMLRSGMPMSGLFDLQPLLSTTISDALHLDKQTARIHSPAFLKPTSTTPVLVILGAQETTEFHSQSEQYCAAWREMGVAIDYYLEPDVDHFDLVNRMADGNSQLFHRMIDWVNLPTKQLMA